MFSEMPFFVLVILLLHDSNNQRSNDNILCLFLMIIGQTLYIYNSPF